MMTIDLFTWWEICISWSIVFLIVAGFYLYASSKPKLKENTPKKIKSWRDRLSESRLSEPGTFTALALMSIIGAFAQTVCWLLPGCIFLLLAMLVAIESQRKQWHIHQFKAKVATAGKNFIFVWTLLGLLAFYIFSVRLGTGTLPEVVFALGNIVVEVLLVLYLLKNRDRKVYSR